MTQDLVSSVPGIYTALLSQIQAAAAAQNPPVNVFPFEIGQYEPGSYVTVERIAGPSGSGAGPVYEWEAIGSFAQKEKYTVCGKATVATGDSVTSGTVAIDILYFFFLLSISPF